MATSARVRKLNFFVSGKRGKGGGRGEKCAWKGRKEEEEKRPCPLFLSRGGGERSIWKKRKKREPSPRPDVEFSFPSCGQGEKTLRRRGKKKEKKHGRYCC